MFLFTNFLEWRAEEVQVLLCADQEGFEETDIYSYQDMTVCYGQRPFKSSDSQTEVDHEFPAGQAPKSEFPRDEFPPAQSSKAAEPKPELK